MNRIKPLYVFDAEGKLIEKSTNKDVIKKYGMTDGTLKQNIYGESIFNSKYYFSRNRDFKPPKKKANFNPLYSKSYLQHGIKNDYFINEDQ